MLSLLVRLWFILVLLSGVKYYWFAVITRRHMCKGEFKGVLFMKVIFVLLVFCISIFFFITVQLFT